MRSLRRRRGPLALDDVAGVERVEDAERAVGHRLRIGAHALPNRPIAIPKPDGSHRILGIGDAL